METQDWDLGFCLDVICMLPSSSWIRPLMLPNEESSQTEVQALPDQETAKQETPYTFRNIEL